VEAPSEYTVEIVTTNHCHEQDVSTESTLDCCFYPFKLAVEIWGGRKWQTAAKPGKKQMNFQSVPVYTMGIKFKCGNPIQNLHSDSFRADFIQKFLKEYAYLLSDRMHSSSCRYFHHHLTGCKPGCPPKWSVRL